MWTESHKESLNGSILLLLGVAIWFYSGTFPDLKEGYPGPALFPRLISILLGITGVMLLGKHVPRLFKETADARKDSSPPGQTRIYSLLAGISLIILFPFVSQFTGVVIAVGIVVLGMALLLRIDYLKSGLIAIGTLATIYLIFNVLLGVPL